MHVNTLAQSQDMNSKEERQDKSRLWTEGPQVTGEKQPSGENWEREALREIALAGVRERRLARRWNIFFKLLGFAYLIYVLVLFSRGMPGMDRDGRGPHTAVVDVQGVIAEGSPASADMVTRGLKAAFEHADTRGVILRINSPGGSPVQSGYINDAIVDLRGRFPDTPIYAVISDAGASGAYYVAVAADGIYADKASIVGSIGVRLDSFGLVEAMERIGVERRSITAGDSKALLDPFLPLRSEDQAHLQGVIDVIHRQFVDAVKAGRGDRLADDPRLFSGLIWSGEEAQALGLVDGLGSADHVAREVIGEPRMVDFTQRQDFFTRLSENLGGVMLRLAENAAWGQMR